MGQGMPPVWSFVLFALAFTMFFILGPRYIRSAVRMSSMSVGAAAPPMNPAMAPETTLNSATR